MLSDEEIARRLPVWTALSDLFLDTELQEVDYWRITAVLHASGYPLAVLRRIFDDEVTPAFIFNLNDVAGAWAGWTDEGVRQRVVECLADTPFRRWSRQSLARPWRSYLDDKWRRVAAPLADS